MTYSPNYCGITLHGAEINAECMRSLYNALYAWQTATDREPSYGALGGEGFSGKVVKFASQRARLQKLGFETLEGFDLYTPLPDAKYPNAQWSVYSSASQEYREVVICASASLVTFDLNGSLAEFVHTAIGITRPKYGYGFYRGGGAEFYAIAVPTARPDATAEDDREARQMQAWRLRALPNEVYLQGILRDAYPWNFLNAAQLAMPVEGQSLQHWIAADPARGTLHSGYDGLTLWSLTEPQRAAVRPALDSAGLIFHDTSKN